MCGRFVYKGEWEDLQAEFPGLTAGAGIRPNFNAAPTQKVPVLLWEEGSPRLEAFQWGLVPFWAGDPAIGSRMINARAETVAEKGAYKHLFVKQRIIVPMDGFYEWQEGKPGGPLTRTGKPARQLRSVWTDAWDRAPESPGSLPMPAGFVGSIPVPASSLLPPAQKLKPGVGPNAGACTTLPASPNATSEVWLIADWS